MLSPRMLRSLPLALLLAVLLLAAQQGAAVHQLGHAEEQLSGLAHDNACGTCLIVAALDTPAVDVVGPAAAPRSGGALPPAARGSAGLVGGASCAYRSRARPRLA